jgi:signal transduction histidine kinase
LSGEHVSYEEQVPFVGSGPRYLHVSYTPDFDASERIVGWVACVVDVTDIAVLKRMENELLAAIQTRDDFISIASHELKTPLAALHMQLDLLNHFVRTAGLGLSIYLLETVQL